MAGSEDDAMHTLMSLPLKAHIISSSLLLIKFEHIGAQTEFPEDTIAKIFELSEHLVFLLVLLNFDPRRKKSQ